MDQNRRNNRIFAVGALSIVVLTLVAFVLIRCDYLDRMSHIGGGSRQFSDLEYKGVIQPADEVAQEDEDPYVDEGLYADERPYMHRDTVQWDTETVISEAPTPSTEDVPHGVSIRLKGYINDDDMLFILEESGSGKLHGQFYNQTTNKAFTVEGAHSGKQMQLHSVGRSNWQFTIVQDGDAYKGVATDGQSTYELRLE